MAGGGGRRGGPGARYLRSGGGCCFRGPPRAGRGPARPRPRPLPPRSRLLFAPFPRFPLLLGRAKMAALGRVT